MWFGNIYVNLTEKAPASAISPAHLTHSNEQKCSRKCPRPPQVCEHRHKLNIEYSINQLSPVNQRTSAENSTPSYCRCAHCPLPTYHAAIQCRSHIAYEPPHLLDAQFGAYLMRFKRRPLSTTAFPQPSILAKPSLPPSPSHSSYCAT